jgi:hypothetical protein
LQLDGDIFWVGRKIVSENGRGIGGVSIVNRQYSARPPNMRIRHDSQSKGKSMNWIKIRDRDGA